MAEHVNWPGYPGNVYQFELYLPSAAFYEVGGVYILCRRFFADRQTRYEAFYVGETESFKDRLNTERDGHDGYKRASAYGFDHICALVVAGGKANRLGIETELRHVLKPICNRQSVPTMVADLLYPKG